MSRLSKACGLVLSLLVFVGCASVDEQLENTISESNSFFESGHYEDALAGYQSILAQLREEEHEQRPLIELQVGECYLELGDPQAAVDQFERMDVHQGQEQYELDTNLLHRKCLAHGESLCEGGRRLDPILEPRDNLDNSQNTRRSEQSKKQFEAAIALFDQAVGMREDQDSILGLAYAWVRVGLLTNSSSALKVAESWLDRQRDQEGLPPRALLCEALLQSALLGGGKMTPASFRSFGRAVRADREEGNYDFHEVYREIYARVREYRSPAELQALESDDREMVGRFVDQLRHYLQCSRVPTEKWPHWLHFREHLGAYLAGYDAWALAERNYRDSVEQAERLIRDQGQVKYLDAFARAMKLLEAVDSEFQQESKYKATRRDVQQLYVEALLEQAKLFAGAQFWDQADSLLAQAQQYADRDYIENHQQLIRECAQERNRVREFKKFAQIRADVMKKLASGGKQEALDHLAGAATNLDAALLAAELDSLRNTISKEKDLQQFNKLLQEALAHQEGARLTDAAEKYEEAVELAQSTGLDQQAPEAIRGLARVHYDNGSSKPALAYLDQLTAQSPDDAILEALCHYREERYGKAGASFARAGLEEVAQWSEEPALRIAGVSLLRSGSAVRAQVFLERAESADPGNPEVREALLECYRQQLESSQLGTTEERELREKTLELSPNDWPSVRRLALIYFELGEHQEDLYREAYDLFYRYSAASDAPALNQEDAGIYAKLVAAYADYVPLRVDHEWIYEIAQSQERRYRVLSNDGANFDVEVTIGSQAVIQEWLKISANKELRRRAKRQDLEELLPIGLRTPTQVPFPRRRREDRLGAQVAEIVAIGETVRASGRDFHNCLKIRTYRSSNDTPTTDGTDWIEEYYLAPEVGIVRYANKLTGETRVLRQTTLLDSM